MAITVKEALAKYGVSAERFNKVAQDVYAKGAGKVCDTQALLAFTETIPNARKEDEE